VTRIWEYRESESQMDPVKIVLRHNPVTKDTSLSVAGTEQPKGTLIFQLPTGQVGRIVIESGSKSFFSQATSARYMCFLTTKDQGQIQIPESNEKLQDQSENVVDLNVELPEVVVDGTKTVWYLLKVRLVRVYRGRQREMHFAVHRRFRDFRFAYSQICSAFRGTHMLSSVPKHPPRHNKLLQDHLRADFLETRRQELENWLRRTLLVPRVAVNPDMEAFLGMGDPSMREVSVVITEGQFLGLRLKKRPPQASPRNPSTMREVFPQAQVVDYQRSANGQPGVAERSGLVGVGDIVSKIGGVSVVHALYEEIVPRLKNTPKPLIVHFLGYTYAGGANSDNRTSFAPVLQAPSNHVDSGSFGATGATGASVSQTSYVDQAPPVTSTTADFASSPPVDPYERRNMFADATEINPTDSDYKESVSSIAAEPPLSQTTMQNQTTSSLLSVPAAPSQAQKPRTKASSSDIFARSSTSTPGQAEQATSSRSQRPQQQQVEQQQSPSSQQNIMQSAPVQQQQYETNTSQQVFQESIPDNYVNTFANGSHAESDDEEGAFEGTSSTEDPSMHRAKDQLANLNLGIDDDSDAKVSVLEPEVTFASFVQNSSPVIDRTDDFFTGPTEADLIMRQQQQQQQQQQQTQQLNKSNRTENTDGIPSLEADDDEDLVPSAYNDDDLQDVSF